MEQRLHTMVAEAEKKWLCGTNFQAQGHIQIPKWNIALVVLQNKRKIHEDTQHRLMITMVNFLTVVIVTYKKKLK